MFLKLNRRGDTTVKEQITEIAIGLSQSPKTAVTVSGATTGAGLGTYLDLIPNEIGKLATLIGIVLSIVLIYVHLKKSQLDSKRITLEMEILKQREEDRRREVAERKQKGMVTRRAEDHTPDPVIDG